MSMPSVETLEPDRSASTSRSGPAPLHPPSLPDRLDDALLKLDLLRDRPMVSLALAVVAVTVAVGGWWLARPDTDHPVEAGIPFVSALTSLPATTTQSNTEPLVVHVAGAVVDPGIVVLEPGARIVDAIDKAGGPTGEADLHRLNLAAPVSDGMQVRVPVPGEVVPANGVAGSPTDTGDGLIDLNQASAGGLEALPGIGPALAKAIVDWRTEHGAFASLDDLLAVPGIGPAKLATLADQVTL